MPGQNTTTFTSYRSRYQALAVLLAILTGGTFAVERLLYGMQGVSLGELPAIVMGGVVLAVAGGVFYAGAQGRGFDVGFLVAGGPVAGFTLYLIAYHLVLPPSSDSPTSLVFLGFAGSFAGIGVVGYVVGRLYSRTT